MTATGVVISALPFVEIVMRRPVVVGCGILLAAWMVGCGGSSGDSLAKESLNLLNEMTSLMEKVTDMKSMKDAESRLQGLKKRADELGEKMKKLSSDEQKALETKYGPEMKAAAEKLMKASLNAAMKAGGGLFPPVPPK